jgi:hypothetical protein
VLAAALLILVPFVLAHGDDGDMDMGMEMSQGNEVSQPDEVDYPPTYFTHPEHRGTIYAHIALMAVGWVFILPVGEFPNAKSPESWLTANL